MRSLSEAYRSPPGNAVAGHRAGQWRCRKPTRWPHLVTQCLLREATRPTGMSEHRYPAKGPWPAIRGATGRCAAASRHAAGRHRSRSTRLCLPRPGSTALPHPASVDGALPPKSRSHPTQPPPNTTPITTSITTCITTPPAHRAGGHNRAVTDGQAATIAKRLIIGPPVAHRVLCPRNMAGGALAFNLCGTRPTPVSAAIRRAQAICAIKQVSAQSRTMLEMGFSLLLRIPRLFRDRTAHQRSCRHGKHRRAHNAVMLLCGL